MPGMVRQQVTSAVDSVDRRRKRQGRSEDDSTSSSEVSHACDTESSECDTDTSASSEDDGEHKVEVEQKVDATGSGSGSGGVVNLAGKEQVEAWLLRGSITKKAQTLQTVQELGQPAGSVSSSMPEGARCTRKDKGSHYEDPVGPDTRPGTPNPVIDAADLATRAALADKDVASLIKDVFRAPPNTRTAGPEGAAWTLPKFVEMKPRRLSTSPSTKPKLSPSVSVGGASLFSKSFRSIKSQTPAQSAPSHHRSASTPISYASATLTPSSRKSTANKSTLVFTPPPPPSDFPFTSRSQLTVPATLPTRTEQSPSGSPHRSPTSTSPGATTPVLRSRIQLKHTPFVPASEPSPAATKTSTTPASTPPSSTTPPQKSPSVSPTSTSTGTPLDTPAALTISRSDSTSPTGPRATPPPSGPAGKRTMTEVRSPAAEETFPRLLLGVQQYVAYMTSLDGYHSLQDQMNRFGEHVEYLCQDRETLIPHIKGQVQLLVNEIWPKGKVEVYGSFITGLCLPSSDVDLVVSNIGTDLRQGLFTLADALCRERNIDANKVNRIAGAKVPVIKLELSLRGRLPGETRTLPVDISLCEQSLGVRRGAGVPQVAGEPSDGNPFKVHTGCAAARLVKSYVDALPQLRPLAIILKHFLKGQGLNDTYTGGLSSYCLVMMLVSFLQTVEAAVGHGATSTPALLLAFLYFYATFDYTNTGIRISPLEDWETHRKTGSFQNFFACEASPTLKIEDPFNAHNNIGQSVFQFYRVASAFDQARLFMLSVIIRREVYSSEGKIPPPEVTPQILAMVEPLCVLTGTSQPEAVQYPQAFHDPLAYPTAFLAGW